MFKLLPYTNTLIRLIADAKCCDGQLRECEEQRRRLEDVNMELLLKLENITMSMTQSHVHSKDTSLFAELETLSHSLSVDSFSNQPARPVTVGTQVRSPTQSVTCTRDNDSAHCNASEDGNPGIPGTEVDTKKCGYQA